MWRFAAMVIGLLSLAACANATSPRPLTVPASSTSSPAAATGRWTSRTWYSARYADGGHTAVILTFFKPTGSNCDEREVATVEAAGSDLRAVVRVDEPWAPPTCAMTPSEIRLDLDAPLGNRRLLVFGGSTAFVDHDGQLQLDPTSTPCGRSDCSTPSDEPAPCDTAAQRSAVAKDVDGAGTALETVGCDGSFLVADLTIGGRGCPPEQRNTCARPQRAYFVARGGNWRLVTYGPDMTCDRVYESTVIRFPRTMCTQP